jgi:hypothetical protein
MCVRYADDDWEWDLLHPLCRKKWIDGPDGKKIRNPRVAEMKNKIKFLRIAEGIAGEALKLEDIQ